MDHEECIKERDRVLGLIQYAREEGETDLRQLRAWVESGYTLQALKADRDED